MIIFNTRFENIYNVTFIVFISFYFNNNCNEEKIKTYIIYN